MQKEKVYIYGRHAIEEAQAHAPHVIKKVFTNVKGEGHGGFVALIDTEKLLIPYESFISSLKPSAETALLILGGLTDPHNVGAIIRSAAAFGFSGVLIPERGQAQITGAVVKASAGMVFQIPLVTIPTVTDAIDGIRKRWDAGIYALAHTPKAVSLHKMAFDTLSIFIVGNEGSGISPDVMKVCDKIISIPMQSNAESLNAAAAAAVVMYEWSKRHIH
jgi:23S rRNA (guanosine2251-2'-O)-methyltransferase